MQASCVVVIDVEVVEDYASESTKGGQADTRSNASGEAQPTQDHQWSDGSFAHVGG